MLENNFYMEHCNYFWVADQPQGWTEEWEDISQSRKKNSHWRKNTCPENWIGTGFFNFSCSDGSVHRKDSLKR